jgi:hypothetical protein
MASGSFEIDTFSWYRSLPTNGCGEPYSTGTLFAVGECAFLKPYTFWQYQSTVGFADTSTLSVNMTEYINSNFVSTTQNLINYVGSNARQIVSTIPLMRWISTQTGSNDYIETYPFRYLSQFTTILSTIPSTLQSTFLSTLNSTGIFGFSTINIYPTCAPYSLFSTIPITFSTFLSTIGPSTINFTFQSTIGPNPGNPVSSIFARAEIFDFQSTNVGSNYPLRIQTSNLWLGEDMRDLINTQNYNVFVESQYSLYVSTNKDPFTWVSTTGGFDSTNRQLGDLGYTGRTTVTRIKNENYMEVYSKLMYTPDQLDTQLGVDNSNFYLDISLRSTTQHTESGDVFMDVYAPGENNFTFTLVPISSINL